MFRWLKIKGPVSEMPPGGKHMAEFDIGNDTIPTVTQITTITTAVAVEGLRGNVITVSQTVAAAAEADFVVNNSRVKAGDIVVVCIQDHTSAGVFIAAVAAVVSGQFTIRLSNVHASAAGDDTLTIGFAVLQAAARRLDFIS